MSTRSKRQISRPAAGGKRQLAWPANLDPIRMAGLAAVTVVVILVVAFAAARGGTSFRRGEVAAAAAALVVAVFGLLYAWRNSDRGRSGGQFQK